MSGRHSRPEPRTTTPAKRGALAAGIGVAGLAALAAAPLMDGSPAGAAVAPKAAVTTTDSPSTTDPAPSTTTTTTEPAPETTTTTTSEPAPSTTTTTTTSAVPEYGLQKFRVGVERDPDPAREIPGAINTVTSGAHVVETSPGGEVTREFDCVTEDGTPDDATDTTFCPGEQFSLRQARGAHAMGHLDPTPGLPLNVYYAAPGNTVTVTQTKVVDGLVIDSQTLTLPACESSGPSCFEGQGEGLAFTKSTDMILTDTALPPKAVDDTATTEQNTPVQIDVAANDFSYGANDTYSATVTGIDIAEQPEHGTVTVGATGGSDSAQTMRIAAGAPTLTYTPNRGFTGTDPFRYTLSTKNGASTATVRVTVPAGSTTTPSPDITAPDTSEPGSLDIDPVSTSRNPNSDSDDDLAATGAESAPLVGYGLALLGAGAGAVAIGRHRHGTQRGGRRQRRAH